MHTMVRKDENLRNEITFDGDVLRSCCEMFLFTLTKMTKKKYFAKGMNFQLLNFKFPLKFKIRYNY